jgi:hypothetical protein
MTATIRGATAVWGTSGLFSLLVLVGHRALDSRSFLTVLLVVAVAHVVVVARFHPRVSLLLFLSQSLIVVASIVAIVAYLLYAVGSPSGVAGAVLWHLSGSWSTGATYVDLARYVGLFGVAYVVVALLIARVWRRPISADLLLSCLYAASAVNLACDYALRRPLFQVSGDPDALLFFFLAGLIGLEFSLLLHLLVLVGCAWYGWRARPALSSRPGKIVESAPSVSAEP